MTHFELHGYALVGVFGDGSTRAYSIPGLKELGAASLPMLDKPRISSTIITPSGDIFGWTSPSEIAMLNVWGTGQPLPPSQDKLFNPRHVPRRKPQGDSCKGIQVKPLSHKPDHSYLAVSKLHNVVRLCRRPHQPERVKPRAVFSKDEGFLGIS